MHKLRRAMVAPDSELLSGTAEVDETYVGGISRGVSDMSTAKVPVMMAAGSLGKNRIGRIRLAPTPPGRLQALEFARRMIASGSLVKADGAAQFLHLPEDGYEHQRFVQLGSDTLARVTLPAVHMVAS